MDKNKQNVSLTADYQATFGTEHGKRVLQDLMKKGGMLDSNYVPNDSYGTAYNEGARSLVLHIIKLLKLDVKKLHKLVTETTEEEYVD